MTLRVALVGGPMYDGLYDVLGDDVEVLVHADHPTLNRAVAELLAAGERIDVLSTHSKYAPSQARWLRALDGEVPVDELAPGAVDLCRFDGVLCCVPRNIDVRTLWVRRDRVADVPATWSELRQSDVAYGFTGRESGLFGTFFEVVTSLGGRLFEPDGEGLRPTFTGAEPLEAAELLSVLAARVPSALLDWHYDDVDHALQQGEVAMAAAWPGGYDGLRSSPVYDLLDPAPYFNGISYAGCHAWAVPTTAGDLPAALGLVARLSSYEAHRRDAVAGTVPARLDAFAAVDPLDATDARRLDILRQTIATGMITYPPLVRFPEVEEAGWQALRQVLQGSIGSQAALHAMQAAAAAALGS